MTLLRWGSYRQPGPGFFAWAFWLDHGRKGPRPNVSWAVPAWAWVRYRIHRGNKPPPPPPPSDVQPPIHPSLAFWHGPGFWVNRTDGVDPDQVAQLALPLGYRLAIVQTADKLDRVDNPQLPAWVARMRQHGFRVAGWSWVEGVQPYAEAEVAVAAVHELDLDGHSFNGEKRSEQNVGSSGETIRRARAQLGPDFPLGWTPEPQLALDHAVFQAEHVSYQPQAYPLENGYDVAACDTIGRRFGYTAPAMVSLVGGYPVNGERFPAGEFARQVKAAGQKGVILYPADACMGVPGYWQELAA